MFSLDIELELTTSSIKHQTIFKTFDSPNEEIGGENKHERRSYLEISGSFQDFKSGFDAIILSNEEIEENEFNLYGPNVVRNIRVLIPLYSKGALELYRNPTVVIDRGELTIFNLSFDFEQFKTIEKSLHSGKTIFNISLSKILTKEQIAENQTTDHWLDEKTTKFGSIESAYKHINCDEDKFKIILVKDTNHESDISVSKFTISSAEVYEEPKCDVNKDFNYSLNYNEIIKELKKINSLIFALLVMLFFVLIKI